MSHFTRLKTTMVEKDYIVKALADLGYTCEVGDLTVRGYGGSRTRVEIKVPTNNPRYDIGFRKSGKSYEMVADWYGIPDIKNVLLTQQLTQRYAYHATIAKLQEQRFSKVSEEVDENGRIHIMLRRAV